MQRNDSPANLCFITLRKQLHDLEYLNVRRVPGGHLTKFLTFLSGDLKQLSGCSSEWLFSRGKVKHIGGISKSLQSEIDIAVDLCKQGWTGWEVWCLDKCH